MNLTNEEKARLTELKRDPVFGSIMQKVRDHGQIPRYRSSEGDETAKVHRWINRSGFAEGVEFVLNTLGYDHEQRR